MMNRTEEARLLYTLLDAAEDEGRLGDPLVAEKWRTLKARFDESRCEQECADLHALLDKLDRSDVLVGTWIQARWFAAKARSASRQMSPPAPPRSRGVSPAEH